MPGAQLGGHGGERKEAEVSEDFTRREKQHFGLHDLEVMETLGEYVLQVHSSSIPIHINASTRIPGICAGQAPQPPSGRAERWASLSRTCNMRLLRISALLLLL